MQKLLLGFLLMALSVSSAFAYTPSHIISVNGTDSRPAWQYEIKHEYTLYTDRIFFKPTKIKEPINVFVLVILSILDGNEPVYFI